MNIGYVVCLITLFQLSVQYLQLKREFTTFLPFLNQKIADFYEKLLKSIQHSDFVLNYYANMMFSNSRLLYSHFYWN